MQIQISPALDEKREGIITLLQTERLPVEDLPATLDNFVVAEADGNLAGVAGIEVHGNYGLLRSVAVKQEYRNKSIAGTLLQSVEEKAFQAGIKEMYLLTNTAPAYFSKKGYKQVEREAAPEAIKQSSEFTHTCPASAVVMQKTL